MRRGKWMVEETVKVEEMTHFLKSFYSYVRESKESGYDALLKYKGFTLEPRASKFPDGGTGLFLRGKCKAGQLVSIYPE